MHGEVHIQIAVPYEDKYAALPLTDIRGVMFVLGVFEPVGVETGDDLKDLLDIEHALDTVPDENPKTTRARTRQETHHLKLVEFDDYDPFKMSGGEGDDYGDDA